MLLQAREWAESSPSGARRTLPGPEPWIALALRRPVMVPDENEQFQVGTCYIGEPAAHLSLAAKPCPFDRRPAQQISQPDHRPAVQLRHEAL
jgi:hypothetical protein